MGRYKVDKSDGGLQGLDSPMIGATNAAAGAGGDVPAPSAGEQDKFLKGDGTWDTTETNFVGTRTQWNKLNLGQKRKFKTADIIKGYLIKYFANGGTGTMPTDEKGIGEVIKIKNNNFTRNNYIPDPPEWIENNGYRYNPIYSYNYESWNTDKEGEGITYYPNDDYVKNESVDLYAQWNSTESGVDTEQYYLTVNKGANMETVSGEAWYNKNTSATASGTAKENYTENTYTVDPNNPGHRYKKTHVYTVNEQTGIVMDEAKTVTVTATDDDTGRSGDQYYLTVRADEHVESYTPSQWSNENSTINITAIAQEGWMIKSGTGSVVMDSAKTVDIVTELAALKFSSDEPFTLSVASPGWTSGGGTIEYSLDEGSTWITWNGSQLSRSANQNIYLRGSGNTVITGSDSSINTWAFTGKYVTGNIETLLGYQTVANGQHPTMGNYCYSNMFKGCTSLTTPPELPAETLTSYCYNKMFYSCSHLTTPPQLPAKELKEYCYNSMFLNCASLTTPPELPATTLANSCYYSMFYSCTSLTTAPELPATTLAENCYQFMFYGDGRIKISTTYSDVYKYEYRIPTSEIGIDATDALTDMFKTTGGTFKGTPTINTTYYTDHQPV